MKKIKKSLGWFFMVGLACDGVAHAQLLGPDGTSPITFEVDSNGLLSDTGTYGTGTLSLSGAGTRMFWYPGKGAFRAGYVSGTDWNDANIGDYSAAFGYNTTASGQYAFASGGDASASSWAATAMGFETTASGEGSMAMGILTVASGMFATAMGAGSTASGYYATALGIDTVASGKNSTAGGQETTANADDAFVIGTYNLGLSATGTTPSLTSWVATDPLFEIGNGTSGTPADALVVYKNGNAALHGYLRTNPGGDLSMGSFTAGTAP